jgi:glucose dehydrogenase
LADILVGGSKTPVYMKADRNGFFYVVNRETGKIISAEKYVPSILPPASRRKSPISGRDRTILSRASVRT